MNELLERDTRRERGRTKHKRTSEVASDPLAFDSERKTGLEPLVAHRQITFRAGWLELEAAWKRAHLRL